ncbi:hypothetical protein [Microbacterium sp.]|uniref:hypothetical protein n=1 Tax=Microbacterium sp. TaxID=51671 RepID=UPI0028112803|nr:hypothetical protein [Microbacterium sp.]
MFVTRTTAELASALLTRGDLERSGERGPTIARAVREGRLRRVRQGRYVPTDLWEMLSPEQRHLLEVVAAELDKQDGDLVASHASSAVLWGLPLYRHAPTRVHGIARIDHRASSTATVLRHTDELPDEDITVRDGIRCTTLSRTAFDLARTLPIEAAVAAVDAAMRIAAVRGQTLDPLRAERWRAELGARVVAAKGTRGLRQAKDVIAFMDGRAQLPGESVSRLHLRRLGFAPPRLQVPMIGPDGTTVWIDFGLDDIPAWGEFDGTSKYLDPALRRGHTVEEALLEEKRREDYLRARTARPFLRWGSAHIGTTEAFARQLRSLGVTLPTASARSRRPTFV